MKIVFFASSHFAQEALKGLIDSGHNIACVVTQPDKRAGRGLSFTPTAIKQMAQANKLEVFQPQSINSDQSIGFLRDFKVDLFVIIAYGQILSEELLSLPGIMSVNIHASLLPKYRGAAPINWAIINGENKTGVTLFKLNEKMDAGPIISKREINIESSDNALTLESKLSALCPPLLLETLEDIRNNKYALTPQVESQVSFAHKLKKDDGLINWNNSAACISNQVRGCLGWPGTFTYYKGKILKIYDVCFNVLEKNGHEPAGQVLSVSKDKIVVATGEGNIILKDLQLEGKKRMKAEEFIAGHKILAGETLKKK
jgi:methionyl-tRNA formyltransferase